MSLPNEEHEKLRDLLEVLLDEYGVEAVEASIEDIFYDFECDKEEDELP